MHSAAVKWGGDCLGEFAIGELPDMKFASQAGAGGGVMEKRYVCVCTLQEAPYQML